MKLNNKGFAITGILYTLFILFIMILLSILSGLSTKKNIMEKSVETLANDYTWECEKETTSTTAPETGKYEFANGSLLCYTYLKSGTDLSNASSLTFTTTDCNNKKTTLTFNNKYCGSKTSSDE